jgi:hypothetical protein
LHFLLGLRSEFRAGAAPPPALCFCVADRHPVCSAVMRARLRFRCNPLATGVRARSFRGDQLLDNNLT